MCMYIFKMNPNSLIYLRASTDLIYDGIRVLDSMHCEIQMFLISHPEIDRFVL